MEMKDDVPIGRIIINKKGEFLSEVSWNDMVAGAMDSIWGYVTGSLKDVTFEIYAREDIKAADGESDDYYKKDELDVYKRQAYRRYEPRCKAEVHH